MKFIQSPNYDKGRNGNKIEKIVIHWFGAGDLASAVAHFQNNASDVSAHYLIENTDVVQMVNEEDTAWHAGNLAENRRSIGIEHSATPDRPATELTYQTSGKLIAQLCKKYSIPLDTKHIVGHKTIKATQCPGTINIEKLIAIAKEGDKSECEQELEDMRTSRNTWRKRAEDAEKTTETQAKDLAKQQVKITDLEKQNFKLSFDAESAKQNFYSLTIEKDQMEQALEDARDDIEILQNEVETLKKKLSDNPLQGYDGWELVKIGIEKLIRKG